MLANEVCAWSLDIEKLIADSRSDYGDLAERAFDALSHIRDTRVREYAFELLQDEKHRAQAVSMLAVNYEDGDREVFVHAVKQIPITYENGEWHGVFCDVMDLFPARRNVSLRSYCSICTGILCALFVENMLFGR